MEKPESVLVDIIGSHLLAIAEEMGVAMMRAAYSPNIKERRDCSTALLDRFGQTIAQAEHIPLHMGSMLSFIPAIVNQYGEDINVGDIFISNDPYLGGSTHLPDVTVVAPLFIDGELSGFAAAVAHHAEMGGAIGSAPDIYSEGLRIPIVRIAHQGVLDDAILRFILINTRVARERLGDLRAQFAAVSLGAMRYERLVQKYGSSVIVAATALWLDKAEKQARAALSTLPRGVFTYQDVVDEDGAGTYDIPICVRIEVSDERVLIDFAGSSDQVKGQINTVRSAVEATVYYAIKAVLDPSLPANAGFYRVIVVQIPEGSILNSRSPAPVWSRSDTCQRAVDVILGALAEVLPDRIPAASNGSISALSFVGFDAVRERTFAYVEVVAGGAGALPDRDGQDAVQSHLTNTANTPVEAVEIAFPLLVRRYALREGSGGLGRFRGGVGIEREVETLVDGIRLTIKGDRTLQGPWGLCHGHSGMPLNFQIDPDGSTPRAFSRSENGSVLPRGTVVRISTAGGGGHGRPEERKIEATRSDVLAGLYGNE